MPVLIDAIVHLFDWLSQIVRDVDRFGLPLGWEHMRVPTVMEVVDVAHMPMDDVTQLWNRISDRSWTGLKHTLEQSQGKAEGINHNLIPALEDEADRKAEEHARFPNSPEELYDALNRDLRNVR